MELSEENTATKIKETNDIIIVDKEKIQYFISIKFQLNSQIRHVKEKYDMAKISIEELNRYAETILSSPFFAVDSPRLLKKL